LVRIASRALWPWAFTCVCNVPYASAWQGNKIKFNYFNIINCSYWKVWTLW
jgi:hypothetical protein